jgi:hypothetical protein
MEERGARKYQKIIPSFCKAVTEIETSDTVWGGGGRAHFHFR